MNIQDLMELVDDSHLVLRTLEKSLREIDRRALNAMVLVKRHGSALAGYGVVAQAFRERATFLTKSGLLLHECIAPLIQAHMHIMQNRRYLVIFQTMIEDLDRKGKTSPALENTRMNLAGRIAIEEGCALVILKKVIHAAGRMQESIAEQEYIVTNGRIEAALSIDSGAPLVSVSREMGQAVSTVAQSIRSYSKQLERILHESGARF